MVKQYAPKQFNSNYDELCNLVVFIIAWKCEQWFTKDLAKKYNDVVFSLWYLLLFNKLNNELSFLKDIR